MNGLALLLGATVIFIAAYIVYGSWLAKKWGVDPSRPTPAYTQKDGIDYLPTKPAVLLGHHFSSIAGAGPIVGPISAAVFGWIPVSLWIIVGSIFFGGVHDYGSMVASIRHKGQSIGQIIESNVGRRAKLLFAIFCVGNSPCGCGSFCQHCGFNVCGQSRSRHCFPSLHCTCGWFRLCGISFRHSASYRHHLRNYRHGGFFLARTYFPACS